MSQNNVGIYASQISGHLWAPNGAYDALATVTVPSGGVASVTFAGIPTGYKHLKICYITRLATGGGSADSFIYAQFNNDTGSNYSWHYILGDGSSSAASSASTQTQFAFGAAPQSGVGSNIFGSGVADILDYSSVSKNKTVRILSGDDRNGSGTVILNSGLWMNSSTAISSINISSASSFAEYSQFALYGIK